MKPSKNHIKSGVYLQHARAQHISKLVLIVYLTNNLCFHDYECYV